MNSQEKKQFFIDLYKRLKALESENFLEYPWFLYNYAKISNRVLELGAGCGHSTIALLFGLEENNGHLWSVEFNKENVDICTSLVNEVKLSHLWTLIAIDDTKLRCELSELDLIFIDTSHQYHHTLYELEYYHQFLKDTGTILCHDVLMPEAGVNNAILSFCFRYPEWKYRIYDSVPFGMGEISRGILPPIYINKIPFGS